jgi:hypothetical protein
MIAAMESGKRVRALDERVLPGQEPFQRGSAVTWGLVVMSLVAFGAAFALIVSGDAAWAALPIGGGAGLLQFIRVTTRKPPGPR